jgi:SNF family Na+-dependent transporter
MGNGQREYWQSRVGLILAVAGNAIGLGNFLRFPVQAAKNGGGAFMIPYFLALLLLGIPLMWAEWAMGRYSGQYGHGTLPDTFHRMWKHPAAKYFGVLGVFLPLAIVIYYTYIESWTLAYSWFAATGKYAGITTREGMGGFLKSFQGLEQGVFTSIATAYLFFLITLGLNIWVLYRGITGGIEKLAKIAMPLLFVFAIVLVVRVLTLGTPDPAYPDRNVVNGLGFIWNPDFSKLGEVGVWLAAAGQIFFTLSLGAGMIPTYASYMKKDQDIAVNALATSTTNEFAEVILGGTIAIPVACAFFGVAGTIAIAQSGAFDLGFQSMPIIFGKIPLGAFFGSIWFLLLFFAGITSSVALASPAVAFLEDEMKLSKKVAVSVVGTVLFVCGNMVIFGLGLGFLDEMDFWVGTFGIAFLGLVEAIIFAWIFGMKKGWEEITRGAEMKVPRIFYFILKYVTPLYLFVLLVTWAVKEGIGVLMMKGVEKPAEIYVRWGARAVMVFLFVSICVMTWWAFRRRQKVEG